MRDRNQPPMRTAGPEDPYRPYMPYTAQGRAAPAHDSAHSPAAHRRHGFAIFHDGNAGHYWRGEVFSNLAEAVLITGTLLWITQLTYSPVALALAVALLAIPWLLAGPLAGLLQGVSVPGRVLRPVGQARVFFTLGLVVVQLIHYRGIFPSALYPVVFGLLFAISLCGRLRQGSRAAAARLCLAPGEVELVANDLQIGAAVVAVIGPLLATLLFVALGERILLVAIGAAVLYFLSANSEGALDALPVERRAFSLVTPQVAVEDERLRAELLAAAQPDRLGPGAALGEAAQQEELRMVAERALPEWYQVGPRSPWQGLAELRAGLGLAALANSSRTSLYVLGSLALIGGGLTVLEVFYVLYVLQVPIYYVGALLAMEAGGLVLGGYVAAGMVAKGSWRKPMALGLLGTGVALMVWGVWSSLLVALGAALLLGAANALAVVGARYGVRVGYSGPERRALTVAEGFVTALCTVGGAGIFVFFYLYLSPTYVSFQKVATNPILARFGFSQSYTSWSLSELMFVTGLLLAFLSVGFGLSLVVGGVGPRGTSSPVAVRPGGALGGIGLAADESMAFPAVGDYDDDGEASRYGPRYAPGYARPASYSPSSARGETGYGNGYGGYGGYGRGNETGYESAAMESYGRGDDDYGDDGGW